MLALPAIAITTDPIRGSAGSRHPSSLATNIRGKQWPWELRTLKAVDM